MTHRRLASGTRVQVGSILITEKFGNMQIMNSRAPASAIVVERADIDDFAIALTHWRLRPGDVTVGSIMVVEASDNLKISTTHTPSNAVTIAVVDIDDLRVAVKVALKHLEGQA